MGNCQAIDAASLIIQHPNGKVDKYYLPISACQVMRMNPGHYVALLLSTTMYPPLDVPNTNSCSVRLTKIKLLKPTDTLQLGHVYRLITTQEVLKGLKAKKQSKVERGGEEFRGEAIAMEKTIGSDPVVEIIRTRPLSHEIGSMATTNSSSIPSNRATTNRARAWQPSLHSILEANS